MIHNHARPVISAILVAIGFAAGAFLPVKVDGNKRQYPIVAASRVVEDRRGLHLKFVNRDEPQMEVEVRFRSEASSCDDNAATTFFATVDPARAYILDASASTREVICFRCRPSVKGGPYSVWRQVCPVWRSAEARKYYAIRFTPAGTELAEERR